MSKDVAIRVEGLGKKYKLGLTHKGTLRKFAGKLLRSKGSRFEDRGSSLAPNTSHLAPTSPDNGNGSNPNEFWALNDVSFEVKRGEVLGVIGRNGAGKSTLLKILSQVTGPTTGRAEIFGRVGSLLEVGTGFHPELTGRENVYLNGAILGMTKREVARKFDEILDFAGVEKFIATPVKRYSSGMKVRLGFAVAAHLEPEILIIDEVLAVGDIDFQRKCLGKMHDVAGHGRTVLFVSHNMTSVQTLCNQGLLLEQGSVRIIGDIASVVDQYTEGVSASASAPLAERHDRKGSGALKFTQITAMPLSSSSYIKMADDIAITLHYQAFAEIRHCHFSIHLKDSRGTILYRMATDENVGPAVAVNGAGKAVCILRRPRLCAGRYLITVSARANAEHLDYVVDATVFHVEPYDVFGTGRVPSYGTLFPDATWTIESCVDDGSTAPPNFSYPYSVTEFKD